jgi:hypothetical protein
MNVLYNAIHFFLKRERGGGVLEIITECNIDLNISVE